VISFSDGISALAFVVSGAALVASTMRWREERKRTIRGQLSDVLRQIGSALLENQKLLHEVGQDNPEYFQQLSAAVNQQQLFLQQQAIYLAVQIPDLVSSVEYIAVAYVSVLQGDVIRADEYYKKAVELAPDSAYRLTARRAYAWFLFTQRRFEEGRRQYEMALSDYTGSDNLARSQRGLTYQFLGQNELNFANAPRRAEEAFESAEGEFKGIDIESVRQTALKNLQSAKTPLTSLPRTATNPSPGA
jgi:tetratricopeptide (TPR) repeat protein